MAKPKSKSSIPPVVWIVVFVGLAIIVTSIIIAIAVTRKPAAPARPAITSNSTEALPPPAVTTTTYSQVPDFLQTNIYNYYKNSLPGCFVTDRNGKTRLTDDKGVTYDPPITIASENSAIATIGCGDLAQHLYVKVGRYWNDIETTKTAFTCANLKKYKVPAELLSVANGTSKTPLNCVPATPTEDKPFDTYKD